MTFYEQGFWAIAIVCLVVLLFSGWKSKFKGIFVLVQRGIIGCGAILILNKILEALSLSVMVGLNPVTALTGAVLGIPGIVLLYILCII